MAEKPWLGVDEHGGVPSQKRPDRDPPPHWRLDAIWATEIPTLPAVSPDGSRSFPSKQLSKGVGEWNHYYVRCVNGEVRLWVNGEEVSGGTGCEPAEGYLALESEGSPVEFKNIRIRELP